MYDERIQEWLRFLEKMQRYNKVMAWLIGFQLVVNVILLVRALGRL